ncbi:MAG TPA: transporter substrate-binding domain-containing protein [Bacteroidales bacterium]|nr:transporter substrate-binding domain-containing protein [Bacteroidales bacterium]
MVKKLTILFAILAAVLTSCTYKPGISHISENLSPNLDLIIKRGKLVAITDYNSINYFIYKGEPMGFNYELLKAFTDHLGVDLEIVTENQINHALNILNSGEADLLAFGLTVNSTRKKEMLFTDPIAETRQVLVQRKPRNWRSITEEAAEKHLIRNQIDLAHKSVYVQANSAHSERLRALSNEIGDSINIIEVPYDSEELIKDVAKGEIDYTVCDENIAMVNLTYYPGIDISTPVSFMQNIAWGLPKNNSGQLLAELNKWIASYRRTGSYALLYAKYFRNSRSETIVKSDYYYINTGKISQWDDMIKSASTRINWDWRLLASLICQESRFDPDVESRVGAYGLMQIMPVTGKNYGIDITASPSDNIKAGTMYINRLQSIFESKITDPQERIKFILASYNAGPGHVLDAIKLAGKNGMNPEKWDGNVAVWLLKKSEPKYFNDSVVKNGYFRGTESVNFVTEVLERYDHYRNIIPEEARLSMASKTGNR